MVVVAAGAKVGEVAGVVDGVDLGAGVSAMADSDVARLAGRPAACP